VAYGKDSFLGQPYVNANFKWLMAILTRMIHYPLDVYIALQAGLGRVSDASSNRSIGHLYVSLPRNRRVVCAQTIVVSLTTTSIFSGIFTGDG
jgi:hypothetical protein